MARTLGAAFLTAAIVFVWTFVSWMLLPMHGQQLSNFPGPQNSQNPIVKAIEDSGAQKGMYHYPGIVEGEGGMEQTAKLAQEGPIVRLLVFQPDGEDMMSLDKLAVSFLLNFLAAWTGIALLRMSGLRGSIKGMQFMGLMGLFAGFAATLLEGHWFGLALSHSLLTVVDLVVSFGLAGLVVGKWAARDPAPPAETA